MRTTRLWVLINGALFTAMVGVNYLANALPLAGRTSAEVSGLFPTWFTPAGFTFAIWGVIYLLLLGSLAYQASFWNTPPPPSLARTQPLWALSCVANAAWLFAFHNLAIELAMGIMAVLLGTLIAIYTRLGVGRDQVTSGERWGMHVPFGVYLGWISVATIANAAIFFTDLGWQGQPLRPEVWGALMIGVATALGLAALALRRDVAFALVIGWALFGIYAKHSGGASAGPRLVEITALVGLATVGLAAIGLWMWRKRRSHQAIAAAL